MFFRFEDLGSKFTYLCTVNPPIYKVVWSGLSSKFTDSDIENISREISANPVFHNSADELFKFTSDIENITSIIYCYKYQLDPIIGRLKVKTHYWFELDWRYFMDIIVLVYLPDNSLVISRSKFDHQMLISIKVRNFLKKQPPNSLFLIIGLN